MLLKYTDKIILTAFAIFVVPFLLVSFDLAGSYLAAVEYQGDIQMAEAKFWKTRKIARSHSVRKVIPAQLPGPLDGWAGDGPKEIVVRAPLKRPAKVTLFFLDSHELYPPTLEIIANGHKLGSIKVKKGKGLISNLWWKNGSRSRAVLRIPEEYSGPQGLQITLRNVEGSWVAIEKLKIAPEIDSWKYYFVITGLPLILIFVWCSFIRKKSLITRAIHLWTVTAESKRVCKGSAIKAVVSLCSLLVVLAIPTGATGIFSGLPFETTYEFVSIAVIIPLLVTLNFSFLKSRFLLKAVMIGAVLKLAIFSFAAPAGVCLKPIDPHSSTPAITYEGLFANGCFTVRSPLEDTRQFPMHYLNYYYDLPDPEIKFSFYVTPPPRDWRLNIDTNGYPVSVDSTPGANKSESYDYQKYVFEKEGGYERISGKIDYKWSGPKWHFIPFLSDQLGNAIEDGVYFPIFYQSEPKYQEFGRIVIGLLCALFDMLFAATLLVWTLSAFCRLKEKNQEILQALAAIALAWSFIKFIPQQLGYKNLLETGVFSKLAHLLPERLEPSFELVIYVVVVAFFVRFWKEASAGNVFVIMFALVMALHFQSVLDSAQTFRILEEGDDWRTYQRWGYSIFAFNPFMTGQNCPPTWNLPFAYFVAVTHILGGQSLAIMQIFDIYALSAIMTFMVRIGRQWGLPTHYAWASGFIYLFLHKVLMYDGYIGRGLTEHISMLAIALLYLLFARHRDTKESWIIPLACAIFIIALGWRPNFLPWFIFSLSGLLLVKDVTRYRNFILATTLHWRKLALLLSIAFLYVFAFMLRNYFECGQFVYIHPVVKNMYALGSLESRFDSILSMITMVSPQLREQASDPVLLGAFSAVLALGWAFGLVAAVVRKGPFDSFPLTLAIFSWIAFLIYFFKFNINAGYNVRWGIPLMPMWVLSFVFAVYGIWKWRRERESNLSKTMLRGILR